MQKKRKTQTKSVLHIRLYAWCDHCDIFAVYRIDGGIVHCFDSVGDCIFEVSVRIGENTDPERLAAAHGRDVVDIQT